MRVLLIDDHTLVRKGLEQLLQSRGVEIAASVSSGVEGIAQAQALKPDIVLLDMKMPEMSGTETLKQLRAAGVKAPILMLTMSREEQDLRACPPSLHRGRLRFCGMWPRARATRQSAARWTLRTELSSCM